MFENLKQNKEYGIIQEALNSLNAVSEPHKSKIIAGFKALDALGNSMKGYKEADTGLAVLANQGGQILQTLDRAAIPSGFYTQPTTAA